MPEPQPGTGPAGQTRPTEPPATPGGTAGPIPAQRGPADGTADTATDATPREPTDSPGDQSAETRPTDGPEVAGTEDAPDAPVEAPDAADAADATEPEPMKAPGATGPEDAPDAADRTVHAPPDAAEPADGVAESTVPVSPPGRPDTPGTEVVAPRWTGSAAVPPAARRKRRWLETELHDEGPPPARDPAPPRNPTLELPAEERETLESRAPVDPWADADHPWDEDYESWAEQPDHWQPPVRTQQPPLPATRPYPVSPPAPHHPVPQQHHSPLPGTRPYPVPPPGPRHPAPGPPALPAGPPPGPPQRSSAPPALPAPRGPSAPERRKSKRSRDRQPPDGYGPQPAPPGWRAPPGYVPVAVRRRRRWPGFMTMFTLLTIACCCGCPAYYGKPMWEQYPASATIPAQVADLSRRDDSQSKRAAQRLEQDMRTAHTFAEGTFAGVYSDPSDKRVTVFGVTGFRFSPDKDLDAEVTRLTEAYQLTDPRSIDTGIRGEYLRCGTGRVEATAVVLCTWADHGSLATALFDRRSVADSAQLVGDLRENIVRRG
jgi:hypothetical protein